MEDFARTASFPAPAFFSPHPNLSDEINRNIIQSEVEGGVYLDALPWGTVLKIDTQNRQYTLEYRGEGCVLISGHPKFCPDPVLVRIGGSSWGGSMLKTCFIGRGMHLEFVHPSFRNVTTSRILEIRTAA